MLNTWQPLYALHERDANCKWYVMNDTWDIQMSSALVSWVYPGGVGKGGVGKAGGSKVYSYQLLMMKQPDGEVCRASVQHFMLSVHTEVTNCFIGAEWHATQTESMTGDGCRAIGKFDNVLLPSCI